MNNRTFGTNILMLALVTFFAVANSGVGAEMPVVNTTVNQAAGASLASGVKYLLGKFVTANDWTFAVDPWEFPVVDRVFAGYVTNRYRVIEKEIDIYKWDYRTIYFEEYEVMKKVQGESVDNKLNIVTITKRRRIASPADARSPRYVIRSKEKIPGTQRKTGKSIQKERILDPNGPFTQRHKVYTTDKLDGDGWSTGFLGQNAMVLLALRKSGMPENHSQIKLLADSLIKAIEGYSAPDGTWDLAWLAAAFANMHNDNDYKKTREMLINKLLDGQITKGLARGMWGPICINRNTMSRALVHHNVLVKRFERKKQKLNPNKHARRINELDDDMNAALESMGYLCKKIAQQGLRFQQVKKFYDLPPIGWGAERAVRIEGLPYYFYSQDTADIESTAIALYAIREAAENGYLPSKTLRPSRIIGGIKMTWSAAESSSAILARAANAIVSLQKKDGTWDEVNINQPNDEFAKVDMPPIKDSDVWVVPPSKSILATAQAYSGLLNAGRSVGLTKLLGRYKSKVISGDKAWKGAAVSYLRDENTLKQSDFFTSCMPYDFFFYLSSIHRDFGGETEKDRELWQELSCDLMAMQHSDGTWGGELMAFKPTSAWYATEFSGKKEYEEKQKKLPENKRVPFDRATFWEQWRIKRGVTQNNLPFTTTIASTCYSMLFLADGAFPPIGLLSSSTVRAKVSPVMSAATKLLLKHEGMSLTYIPVIAANAKVLKGLPVVFADSRLLLKEQTLAATMKNYLKISGVLIVNIVPGTNMQALEEKLKSFVPDGKIVNLPAEASFLEKMKTPLPSMKCLVKSDGSVSALLVTGTSAATSDVVYRLARQSIYSRYGIRYFLSGGRNPTSQRLSLLSKIEREPISSKKAPAGTTPGPTGRFNAPQHRALAEDEVW